MSVALYGEKPVLLARLISECQARITSAAGAAFLPYDMRQVHANIISLGKTSAMINDCFYEYRARQVRMDFDGLLSFLRSSRCLPFHVQIGGFQNRDYPFVSRGLRPYERSFSFQDGKAVMIGWPIGVVPTDALTSVPLNLIYESRIYPNTLDQIRQAVQGFGFLHRYHRKLGDIDNDFYFRIGLFDPVSFPEPMQREIEHEIRQFLSESEPIIVEITPSDVYIVFSDNETLSLDSTVSWPVSDPSLTADLIKNFYG